MPDSPSDTRFQYEVIKGLAESVRQMAQNMADMQKTQVDMLVRLARLEENKVGDELVAQKADIAAMGARIDALERVHDEARGARKVWRAVREWWPVIACALLVVWTLGRAIGVFHLPERPVIERQQQEPRK